MSNERKSDKLGRCLCYFPKGDVPMYPHDHAPEEIHSILRAVLFTSPNETLSQMRLKSQMRLNGPFWDLYWHLHDSIKEENHAQ